MLTKNRREMMEQEQIKKLMQFAQSRLVQAGFAGIVMDLEKSYGNTIVDATGTEYLDLSSQFASQPLAFDHPDLRSGKYMEKLGRVAGVKITNNDMWTIEYLEFLKKFMTVCVPSEFKHFFPCDSGALAVENALKTAFDWRMQKNRLLDIGGVRENDLKIIHFKDCFHGRSGYTMSLTNTSSMVKTRDYPKLAWPRFDSPCLRPVRDGVGSLDYYESKENKVIKLMNEYICKNRGKVAAIIIEPIQGEGGDRHFRPEFFQKLRKLADRQDVLLIFDEVQTGFGGTGSWWMFENIGVTPDIFCFGKKSQAAGICVTDRIDDIRDNVFNVSSRIDSTFGGCLTDMVNASRIIETIGHYKYLDNARNIYPQFRAGLSAIADRFPQLGNVRGIGTFIAFDLPTPEFRDRFWQRLLDCQQMITLCCGELSIRFRTTLDMDQDTITDALDRIESTMEKMY